MNEFSEFKLHNHYDRLQAVMTGQLVVPVTMEIDPTNLCNHRCVWCIEAKPRAEVRDSLEWPRLGEVVDELGALGVKAVTVKGGGEPLMYAHVDDLLRRIRSAGMKVGLITNGELMHRHLDVITETCEWVRVSLDAGSETTHNRIHRPTDEHAFYQVLTNISAVSGRVFTGVVMVVSPDNFHEMPLAAAEAKKHGARYVNFKKAYLNGGPAFSPEALVAMDSMYVYTKRDLEDPDFAVQGFRIYNFKKDHRPRPYTLCKAHHLIGILCADGGVYACCTTRGAREFLFGSIYEQSFKEIWYGPERRRILDVIDGGSCRDLCVGRTTYMRYDHYNHMMEYLLSENKPHGDFL